MAWGRALYMISTESPCSKFGSGVSGVHCTCISAESPGSMTLGSGVRVLYCTCIWSQLSLWAVWRLDMEWWACTVRVYDLSWVSGQHDIGICCEGPVLYLYMISAKTLDRMGMMFGYGMRGVHYTCIWSQLSVLAAWRWDIWRESRSGGEGPFKDHARLIPPLGAVQQATTQVTAER